MECLETELEHTSWSVGLSSAPIKSFTSGTSRDPRDDGAIPSFCH